LIVRSYFRLRERALDIQRGAAASLFYLGTQLDQLITRNVLGGGYDKSLPDAFVGAGRVDS